MYRILVVDDEDIITDSLAHMLESLTRFELDVYKAYSAVEALKQLAKMSIDIVITDIQMPGKTGLELLKDIRGSWPDCQVIFLTGYNEFEYATHAVKYHAARYILKTEGYEPLIEAVADSIQAIEKEERNTAILEKAREQVDRYLPLVRQNFLGSVLSGDRGAGRDLAADFTRLEISLDAGAPAMLLAARLDPPASAETANSVDLAVHKKIPDGLYIELAWTGAHIITWIVQYPSTVPVEHARAKIKGMAEYVQRFCSNILQKNISFVFDSKPAPWPELAGKFAELKFVLMNRLEPRIALAEMDYYLGTPFDAGTCGQTGSGDPVTGRPVTGAGYRQGHRGPLSQRVQSYLQENLGADLSLYALSEKFFLNPSYLSRRFKEETGKNITNTVADLRLREACRLLRETERKINRIAVMVGYESPAYFSNIFKRRFGVSPQEYRDTRATHVPGKR
jgi:two-component system response regulator YesN